MPSLVWADKGSGKGNGSVIPPGHMLNSGPFFEAPGPPAYGTGAVSFFAKPPEPPVSFAQAAGDNRPLLKPLEINGEATGSLPGTDWTCKCGQVNYRRDMFSTGNTCKRCSAPRIQDKDMDWDEVKRLYNKGKRRKKRKKSSSSSSTSSSSGSSRERRRRRSRSRSKQGRNAAASVEDVSDSDAPAKSSGNSEIEKAKNEALQKVLKIRDSGAEIEERRRQWRALLREWHPDKHKDTEVATAVFQFLQKAKDVVLKS